MRAERKLLKEIEKGLKKIEKLQETHNEVKKEKGEKTVKTESSPKQEEPIIREATWSEQEEEQQAAARHAVEEEECVEELDPAHLEDVRRLRHIDHILSLWNCNYHFNLDRARHGVLICRILDSLCEIIRGRLISGRKVLTKQCIRAFELKLVKEVVIVNASHAAFNSIVDG